MNYEVLLFFKLFSAYMTSVTVYIISLRHKFYFEDILYKVAFIISTENNWEYNFIIYVKTLQNIFADDIENDDKDLKNFILKIKLLFHSSYENSSKYFFYHEHIFLFLIFWM